MSDMKIGVVGVQTRLSERNFSSIAWLQLSASTDTNFLNPSSVHDKVRVKVNYDECQANMTPNEAHWELFEYPLFKQYHCVHQFFIYLKF